MRLTILATLLAVTGVTPAHAVTPALEDLAFLDARIAVFLGGTPVDAGKKAQPVDRRLRLLACAEGPLFDPLSMGAIAAYCPSRGWRVRVPLIGGAPEEVAEIVVRRGDAVQLAYAGSGFDVTTSATALEDGRTDGVVRVKASTGASTVTARVRGPGLVVIGD
jgi:flagellar basal body P-ring formation protein FlgA